MSSRHDALLAPALAATACLCLFASPVGASPPSPALSTKPSFVSVVGENAGAADTVGACVVIVRSVSDNPYPGQQVVLDFSACTDLRLCPVAPPGVVVDCAARTITAVTDLQGTVRFAVLGAGTNTGASPGPGAGCLNILAGGVSLIHATVRIYDEDGAVGMPGVDVTDVTAFLKDLGSGTYFGRSDFSGNGSLDLVDFSLLLAKLGAGTSAQGCGGYCP